MSDTRKFVFSPFVERTYGKNFSQPGRTGRKRNQRIVLFAAWILFSCSFYSIAFQDPGMPPVPPFAEDDSFVTQYNTPIWCDILSNDTDGSEAIDMSTISIVTPPASGTAQVDPVVGDVLYTPNPGFVGTDQFEYTVSDTEGNVSNIAVVTVDAFNVPPEIVDFTVIEGSDDVWIFEGSVSDENPSTVTITFGGLLEGDSTTVDEDGTFSFAKALDNGEEGGVSAQATDELGEKSEIAYDSVIRT